ALRMRRRVPLDRGRDRVDRERAGGRGCGNGRSRLARRVGSGRSVAAAEIPGDRLELCAGGVDLALRGCDRVLSLRESVLCLGECALSRPDLVVLLGEAALDRCEALRGALLALPELLLRGVRRSTAVGAVRLPVGQVSAGLLERGRPAREGGVPRVEVALARVERVVSGVELSLAFAQISAGLRERRGRAREGGLAGVEVALALR